MPRMTQLINSAIGLLTNYTINVISVLCSTVQMGATSESTIG